MTKTLADKVQSYAGIVSAISSQSAMSHIETAAILERALMRGAILANPPGIAIVTYCVSCGSERGESRFCSQCGGNEWE